MPTPKGGKTWNAGTSKGWTDKRGYRWLYVTEGGKRRARREHRVIMEQHIGRRLEPWEAVHHINGDTADNCITNLQVVTFDEHTIAHHTGTQRRDQIKQSLAVFAQLREEIKHLRSVNAALLESCKAMDDVASWLQNFFNDVMNTTPEYAELCGDWNAVTYLMNEASTEQEQLRAAIALAEPRDD